MSVRIYGMSRTKAALKRVQAEAEAAAGPASKAGGEIVQREMASRAPSDTGALISMITTDEDSLGSGATTKVGSEAPYDRFVQLGTVHMAAQPYGEQAAAASVPGIIAAMTSIFKAAVEG
jgi:HK97 gp10 family phage protein